VRVLRERGAWTATLIDAHGERRLVRARSVVNATGPWVGSFLDQASPVRSRRAVRLVKGSHIVVPKMFEHDFAYIFQNIDRRIIFAIPYEREFTLVGTTDVEFRGDPSRARIAGDETAYLCDLASRHFRRAVSPAEVVWSYSGVRPLLEDESSDPSSVTRDYTFELDADGAPLLSVFGGKLTTYRRLAEDALGRLLPALGLKRPSWTARAALPGGDVPGGDYAAYRAGLGQRYPEFPPRLLDRWARAYGTRLAGWLGHARTPAELGAEVVPGLHAAEIAYLCRSEWARSAEDILWRRSKLGLHAPPDASAALDAWLAARPAG
jgi:glycerol-3-phosphate dehydrogenase